MNSFQIYLYTAVSNRTHVKNHNRRSSGLRGILQLNFQRRIAPPGTEFYEQKASALCLQRTLYNNNKRKTGRSDTISSGSYYYYTLYTGTVLFANFVTSSFFPLFYGRCRGYTIIIHVYNKRILLCMYTYTCYFFFCKTRFERVVYMKRSRHRV